MLVLSRKINESIMIGDQIEVIVLDVRDGHVKLGIKAPRDISVHRQEIYVEIKQENTQASQQNPQALASAARALQGSVSKKIKQAVREETQQASQPLSPKKGDSLRSLGKALKPNSGPPADAETP
jgi:carbon storage regulator